MDRVRMDEERLAGEGMDGEITDGDENVGKLMLRYKKERMYM
jgi:hypothetical protein